jgi:transcriptional regulator with XRE-family HTH domain
MHSERSKQVEEFGKLLHKGRIAQGLTVRGVAGAAHNRGQNVSIALVSLLEQNRRIPSYSVAYVLAEVLGLDIEIALAAAYRARMEHYYNREVEGLEATITKRRLGPNVDATSIVKRLPFSS